MYADNRETDTGVGFNGFAILTFEDRTTMKLEYYEITAHDDEASAVVSERFAVNRDGRVARSGIHAFPAGVGFINGRDVDSAQEGGSQTLP